jgi:hypothetical protein
VEDGQYVVAEDERLGLDRPTAVVVGEEADDRRRDVRRLLPF